MVHRIYSSDVQLNKANASDTEAAFLDLDQFIMIQFLQKYIINGMDNFRSLMAMSLDVPLMVYIYLN